MNVKIKTIKKELKKLKSNTKKRLYLARQITNVIQDAIEKGDPHKGEASPVYKWLWAEADYLKAVRNITSKK